MNRPSSGELVVTGTLNGTTDVQVGTLTLGEGSGSSCTVGGEIKCAWDTTLNFVNVTGSATSNISDSTYPVGFAFFPPIINQNQLNLTISGEIAISAPTFINCNQPTTFSGVISGSPMVNNISSDMVTVSGNITGTPMMINCSGNMNIGGAGVNMGDVGSFVPVTIQNLDSGGTVTVRANTMNNTLITNDAGTMNIQGIASGQTNVIVNNGTMNIQNNPINVTASLAIINVSGAMYISQAVTGGGDMSSLTHVGGTMYISNNVDIPHWVVVSGTINVTGGTSSPTDIYFALGDGNLSGVGPVSTGVVDVQGGSLSPAGVGIMVNPSGLGGGVTVPATIGSNSDLVRSAQTTRSFTVIRNVTNTPTFLGGPTYGGLFSWSGGKVGNDYVINLVQSAVDEANLLAAAGSKIDINTDLVRETARAVAEINASGFQDMKRYSKNLMRRLFRSKGPLQHDMNDSYAMQTDMGDVPFSLRLTPYLKDLNIYVSGIHMRGKSDAVSGMAAAHDTQSGMIAGLDYSYKPTGTYIWAHIGAAIGSLEADKDPRNNARNKTFLVGATVTQDFLKEAEWVTKVGFSRTWNALQRVALPAISGDQTILVHSSSVADYAMGETALAYKLKWKQAGEEHTKFSLRPYVGIQGTESIRYPFSEKDGGNRNIRRGRLDYNTVNGTTGVGIRWRHDNQDWAIKATMALGLIQQLNNPKIEDVLYTTDSPEGFKMDLPGSGKTTLLGNFALNFARKNEPWKVAVVTQLSRKAHRSTQSCMLQYTRSF